MYKEAGFRVQSSNSFLFRRYKHLKFDLSHKKHIEKIPSLAKGLIATVASLRAEGAFIASRKIAGKWFGILSVVVVFGPLSIFLEKRLETSRKFTELQGWRTMYGKKTSRLEKFWNLIGRKLLARKKNNIFVRRRSSLSPDQRSQCQLKLQEVGSYQSNQYDSLLS